MAALYGTIRSDKQTSKATRTANRYIETTAETWSAIVEVTLWHDGRCEVIASDKDGNKKTVLWSGNVNEMMGGLARSQQ